MAQKTILEYQKLVLEKFFKESGGNLHTFLHKPTPKSIKDACLAKYNNECSAIDCQTLHNFFKFKNKDVIKGIKNFDTDKFKPIVNFLKQDSKSTSDINVELISWLIDFEPRPYRNFLKQDETPKNLLKNTLAHKEKREENNNLQSQKNTEKRNNTNFYLKGFRIVIIASLITIIFILYTIGKNVHFISKDVYEIKQIQLKDLPAFAKKHQNVWYANSTKGIPEYFDGAGMHPKTGQKLIKLSSSELNALVEGINIETTREKSTSLPNKHTITKTKEKEFTNKSTKNQLAVFVFDENNQFNVKVSKLLQKNLASSFTIINNNIPNLTNTQIQQLKPGSKPVLHTLNYTNYVCVGNTNVTYKISTINTDIKICTLELIYDVYDKNGALLQNYSQTKTYKGQGFSKEEALNNTLKKIQ